MPVIRCANGKYRIGSGKCMYKTKASAERAYKGYLATKESDMKDIVDEGTDLRESGLELTEPGENGVSEGSILIKAGLNATGRRNWTPEFLQASLPRFNGSFCFMDHPTPVEERTRPERSMSTLSAVVGNPRFDPSIGEAGAVLGDVSYLETAAGNEMKAAFQNETVRARAGQSVYWRGPYRRKKERVAEGGMVEIPIELLGDELNKFDVDFVTRPTAGGEVAPIKEGEGDMAIEDLTLDELQEGNPELVASIGTKAVEDAKAEFAKESDTNPDDEDTDSVSESDREEDLKRIDALEAQNRVLVAEKIVRGKLSESDLTDESTSLIESDFEGAEATDPVAFAKQVDDRVKQVGDLESKLSSRGRVHSIVAESDADGDNGKGSEVVAVGIRAAWGIEDDKKKEDD